MTDELVAARDLLNKRGMWDDELTKLHCETAAWSAERRGLIDQRDAACARVWPAAGMFLDSLVIQSKVLEAELASEKVARCSLLAADVTLHDLHAGARRIATIEIEGYAESKC